MRLVDVTDIEKFICEKVCVIGDDHLLLVAADDGKWHEALPLIKTAYDVDKVVEELEKELEKGNIAIDFGDFRLFEIVKQGGVSDDVCEWNGEKSRIVTFTRFTTSCGDNIDLQTNSELLKAFIYCPFCGKKIKVVE